MGYRLATNTLLRLHVENPQKVLWMVFFLLIFGELLVHFCGCIHCKTV